MDFIISVKDMMCEHCVKSITEAVSKMEDVKDIKVDLPSKTVSGSFNEKKIALQMIKDKINDIGFTAG